MKSMKDILINTQLGEGQFIWGRKGSIILDIGWKMTRGIR